MGLLKLLGIEKYLKKVKTYVDEQDNSINNRINDLKPTTPDWNASYKEDGYIENRTHYETFHFKAEIDNDYKMESVIDAPNSAYDAHWHIEIHVQEHPWELWGEVYTYDGEVFFDIPIEIGPFEISATWADGPIIPLYIREVGATDVWKGTIFITSSTIKPLEDKYIQDTVARKSDVQGFDPIVWKYLCNPIIITEESASPAPLDIFDTNQKYIDEKCQNAAMFKVLYNGNLCNVSKVDYRGIIFYSEGIKYYVECMDGVFEGISKF